VERDTPGAVAAAPVLSRTGHTPRSVGERT